MRAMVSTLVAWSLVAIAPTTTPAAIPAPAPAAAQREGATSAGALRDRFIGTWKLVDSEQRNSRGEVVPPAAGTAERTGYLIYDPAGYMAVSIMPVGRKKYAALQPSDAEAQAALNGYAGYFGTFTIDAASNVITHHTQGSVTPGMATDQKRGFEFNGGRLTLKPPVGANGNQSRLTWERLPDLVNPSDEQRRFFGFWKLISSERRNMRGDLLGANPGQTGYIIYTSAGFMMVHMVRPGRKPFAASQPTGAKARAAISTYTNYFGPFYVHQPDGYLVHDQVGYLNIGRNGYSPFQRFYSFEGRRLLLHPPVSDTPDGQTVQGTITWERVEPVR